MVNQYNSLDGKTVSERTKGGGIYTPFFAYDKETSWSSPEGTEVKTAASEQKRKKVEFLKPGANNESYVPETTGPAIQKVTREFTFMMATVGVDEIGPGLWTIPERKSGKGDLIHAGIKSILSNESSFTPTGPTKLEGYQKFSIIGVDINFFGRFAIDLQYIDKTEVPEVNQEGTRRYVCFAAGTKVVMSNGSCKNIEKIRSGEFVQSYNESSNKIEVKEVLLTEESSSDQFIEIEFEDGTVNKNTPTHPYFVKSKGWSSFDYNEALNSYGISVEKLEEGDIVFQLVDGKLKELKIKRIKKFSETIKVYNLSNIKDNHNFFANGILVHNRS